MIPMAAIRYSIPDPAGSDLYTTAKDIRLLGKFQPKKDFGKVSAQ